MKYDRFIYQVRWQTALNSNKDVVELVESTLEAIGSLLKEEDRLRFAEFLPSKLSDAVLHRPVDRRFELKDFDNRVGRKSRTGDFFRFDHILTVCQVLNELVNSRQREFIRTNLPESLSSLFRPPSSCDLTELENDPHSEPKTTNTKRRKPA